MLVVALFASGCSAAAPDSTGPEVARPFPLPSLTPLAPATPTEPGAVVPRRLTEPGCCARHWWTADSSAVLFIDDPSGDDPLGIYRAEAEGGAVTLAAPGVSGAGLPVEDGPPQAEPAPDPTFGIPPEADNVRLSPDGSAAAWTTGSDLPVNVDRRQRSLWISQRDSPRRLGILTGGDLVGWAGDGGAVIATGRIEADSTAGIWRIPADGGEPLLLAAADRPRGARLSPYGRWLAYYLAFQEDPAGNGLRIVGASGGAERRLPQFGSYRWGPNETLFFIPWVLNDPNLSLAAFDPSDGTTRILLEGGAFDGGIAANDWSISPDGDWMTYRSSRDGALWIVQIPEE